MVVLGAANVGIALWLNIWNRDFFNALEKRDLAQLFELLWILAIIVVSAGIAVAIQLHVKRRLQVNWRSWLSGMRTVRPSSSSLTLIWQDSRLFSSTFSAKSSIDSSMADFSPVLDAQASST